MAVDDSNGAAAADDDDVEWDPRWDEEEDIDTAAAQIADDEVQLSADINTSIRLYISMPNVLNVRIF